MITQKRLEELAAFAMHGSLETMEAIKLAVHESIADEQTKNAEMLAAMKDCESYLNEAAQLAERFRNMIKKMEINHEYIKN